MSAGRRLLFLALAACGLVASCGFRPLHVQPDAEPGRQNAGVLVETVPGAAGFAFRERLVERLGEPENPTHRLAVDLEIEEVDAAITQEDVTTRYLVLGRAVYRLVPIDGEGEGIEDAVTAQTAYSAPIDESGSIFATRTAALAAEERVAYTLAERIALKLSVLDWLEDAGPAR